jgi:hypothetical protein
MSQNYAAAIPSDREGHELQEFPAPYKANARYATFNAIASSVITLNDNTTVVEVSAVGQSVAVRWIPASETAAVSPFASVLTTVAGANFDHVVPANYWRRFVVPVETQGVNSIVVIGVQAGTYRRVAVMSAAAVSSIMVSEF